MLFFSVPHGANMAVGQVVKVNGVETTLRQEGEEIVGVLDGRLQRRLILMVADEDFGAGLRTYYTCADEDGTGVVITPVGAVGKL